MRILDNWRPLMAFLLAGLFVLNLPPAAPAEGDRAGALPFRDDLDYTPNWSVVEGAWRYHDGLLNGSGNDARIITGDAGWQDCNLSGRFKIEYGNVAAIIFRVQEANYGADSGRYFQLSNDVGGTVTLYRISMAAVSQKSAPYTITRGIWYDFTVALNASTVDYYINSTWVLNFTTLDFQAGKFGLKASHSVCHFDNIRVSDKANSTLFSDDFSADPLGGWAPMKGTWSFGGGELGLTTDKTRKDFCVAPVTAGGPAWTARVQLLWASGLYFETGLSFNFGDIDNNYLAYLSAFDSTLRIQRNQGGAAQDNWAQTAFPVKKNELYTITITRNDTLFRFYINSALVLSKSDPSVLPGQGFAFGSWSPEEEKVRYNFLEVVEGEHPPLPDLLINSSTLQIFPPHPNPGDNVKFRFDIVNAGTANAAGNIATDILCNGTLLARRLDNVMPAATCLTVELYWIANLSGNLTITLAADSQNQIPEVNESNNNFTLRLDANIPPAPSFTVSPASGARVMQELELNGTNSTDPDGTITAYYWTFGDGTAASTPVSHHKYDRAGTYTVTLKLTDNDGATKEAAKYVAIARRDPAANISWSPMRGNITTTFGFNFALFDPDDTLTGFLWDFGDGANSSDKGPTHRFSDDGSYNITLTLKYNSGKNTTVAMRELTVDNIPPESKISSAPEELLKNMEGNFSACATDPDDLVPAFSYFWNFGDGSNASGKDVKHAYSRSGRYKVTLNVTDEAGANSSVSVYLQVINYPPVASYAPPPPAYINTTFRFDATTARDLDGSIVNYTWDFGDGFMAVGAVVDHNFSMPGNYTVRLTVTDDEGATNSTSAVVLVREVPKPPPPPPVPPAQPSYLAIGAIVATVAILGVCIALWLRMRKRGGSAEPRDGPDEEALEQGPGLMQG